MIIESVRLKNIRSYTSEEIKFSSGSTLLSGDIGSGKTSILLAIEFALFGVDNDKLSGKALLRKGSNEASVELTFSLNDSTYTIGRSLKRSKRGIIQTAGYLIHNGTRTEGVATELRAKIIEILGYPQEMLSKKKNLLFHYTVYCPQEEMKHILSEHEEIRLDTLRKIFGVDKYKQIRENTQILLRHLKRRIADLNIRLEKLPQIQEEQKNIDNELNMINEQLEQLFGPLQQKKEQLQEQTKKQDYLLEQLRKKHELEKKLTATRSQLKEKQEQQALLEKRLRSLKEKFLTLPQQETSTEQLQQQINIKQQFINKHREQITSLRVQEQQFAIRAKEVEQELANTSVLVDQKQVKGQEKEQLQLETSKAQEFAEKKEEIQLSVQKLRVMLTHYRAEKQKSENLASSLHDLTTCPTCRQEVGDDHKHSILSKEEENVNFYNKKIAEHQQLLQEKTEQLEKLVETSKLLEEKRVKLQRLTVEINHIIGQEQQLEQKKKQLQLLQEKQAEIRTKKSELDAIDIDGISKGLESLREQLQKIQERAFMQKQALESQEQLSSIKETMRMLLEQSQELSQQLIDFTQVDDQLNSVQQLVNDLRKEVQDLLLQEANAKNSLKHKLEQAKKIQEQLLEQRNHQKKKQDLSSHVSWLQKYFLQLVFTMEKHVMLSIHRQFSHFFEQWFSLLIDDDTLIARLSDTFLPIIEQNGYDIEVNHLSGGERTSAALAYRLALNKVINDVISQIKTKDLIILDEPTDGFSSEQLDRMRDVFDQLKVNQLIIVSHENKIESMVDQVVRVEKGESSRVVG